MVRPSVGPQEILTHIQKCVVLPVKVDTYTCIYTEDIGTYI